MVSPGFIIVIILLIVVVAGLVIILLTRRPRQPAPDLNLMFQQVEALRQEQARALEANTRELNQRLAEMQQVLLQSTGAVNTRLDSAAQISGELNRKLGELTVVAQNIAEVGKELASLQEVLRAPKPRGLLGEFFLANILQEMLPGNYELQYRFRSGEKVDAVIRLGERLVPVDAKFPLEDFQRLLAAQNEEERIALRRQFAQTVRRHIDAIARKYILPDEGTYDFALMYIPAENVYYEIIVNTAEKEQSIINYALNARVIPVSPATIYAYLQAILLGLRGMQVQAQAQQILANLSTLQLALERFQEKFQTLGTHLTNAHNRYEEAGRELERLSVRLTLALPEKKVDFNQGD
ncbi:MAG: DNA recombination protein RmuC [candidate division WOR-3 bacterium]|jgi:DNA recombination protein RmuC